MDEYEEQFYRCIPNLQIRELFGAVSREGTLGRAIGDCATVLLLEQIASLSRCVGHLKHHRQLKQIPVAHQSMS